MACSKLLMRLILLGEKCDLLASDVLMALCTIFLFSERALTFSLMFFSKSPQLMSTCSLLYFLRRLMSSLVRLLRKRSVGMVKRTTQEAETYLDLNLLLVMISSSPKKSNCLRRLFLWQELQTARTSHLRLGSGHLLCYRMQMWFYSTTSPLKSRVKHETSPPAAAMVCYLKQNCSWQSEQKWRALLSLMCSQVKKVLLRRSLISSRYFISMSSRSLVTIRSQTCRSRTSTIASSLQVTVSCLLPQKAYAMKTSFFSFVTIFFSLRYWTAPMQTTPMKAGTSSSQCMTSPALQYLVFSSDSMISLTTGGSPLKMGICSIKSETKYFSSEALSFFSHILGMDISLFSQLLYMKSTKPCFWVSHLGKSPYCVSWKSMAFAQGYLLLRRECSFYLRDCVFLGVEARLRLILLSIMLRKFIVSCMKLQN